MNYLNVGHIKLNSGAFLAPMAGATDKAFRGLCAGFGAACTISEMVSAKALTMGDTKSRRLMVRAANEAVYGVQLFGADGDVFAQAVQYAVAAGADFVDINMGCPVPKIVGNGAGAAIMRSAQTAQDIVSKTVAALENIAKQSGAQPLPLTVKIRKGIDGVDSAVDIARACEAGGAAAITVHGRTREQMYAPQVDLAVIKAVKNAVNLPVIGNGDILCAEHALHMLEFTGCDAVMVGRGALGSPWVFEEINAAFKGEAYTPPDIYARMRIMIKHVEALCDNKGEYIGMREARSHCAWYMKGLKGAAELRRLSSNLEYFDDAKRLAERALVMSLA